jgi:hypothetical protein
MMVRKSKSGGCGCGKPKCAGCNSYRYGGMVKKYAVGGPVEGDPEKDGITPEASLRLLALLRGGEVSGSNADVARGDETQGFTTARDNSATTIKGIPLGLGEPLAPEESPRGENMMPVRSRGPQPIRQDLARMLMGGGREEQPREESSSQPIMFEPTTSNVRAYTRKDSKNPDAGYRTLGGEKDAFAQGFRQDGKDMYATPKVFELMKEAGVNARDPYAMEFMKELAQKNPELFTRNQNRGAINSMVMSEVYKDPTQRGFFLQADQPVIKASF